MFTKTYTQAVKYAGSIAPSLKYPTPFIKWAEDMSEMLRYIYSSDYEQVAEDILEAAKEEQDFED